MSENNGGNAFPVIDVITASGKVKCSDGMTLRDYFAGQVLLGMGCRAENPEYRLKQAKIAYEWADAMLEARHPTTPREQGE